MKYILETWETFKKREKLTIYSIRDGGGKGWIRQMIHPTMANMGWNVYTVEEYSIGNPREVAVKEIDSYLCKRTGVEPHFVYAFTKGKNNHMDFLQIFYKKKE
jgi:hypothetical protein